MGGSRGRGRAGRSVGNCHSLISSTSRTWRDLWKERGGGGSGEGRERKRGGEARGEGVERGVERGEGSKVREVFWQTVMA